MPIFLSSSTDHGNRAPARDERIIDPVAGFLTLVLAIFAAGPAAADRSAAAAPASTAAAISGPIDSDCVAHIREAEAHYGIPRNLLMAIGLVESNKNGRPYPWALGFQGRAFFGTSFADAAKQLRDAQGKPVLNVDVGCMQINMASHVKRFGGYPELALIPKNNVWYAAAYLVELRNESPHWSQAVGYYNARKNRVAMKNYLCKVTLKFNELNGVRPSAETLQLCRPSVAQQ